MQRFWHTAKQSKHERIQALDPYLAFAEPGSNVIRGRLRFRDCDDCRLLVEQLMMFPNKEYHDDGPDALEMAIRLLQHNRLHRAESEEVEVYA